MIDLIFITIIVFGIITSYTDIKYGKIKNISIILLLVSGVLINIFITKTLVNFFYQTIINIAVSLIFGFFLYIANLWTEGDAKLFLAYTTLIPFTSYTYGYVQYFPSVAILINTFVPVAIFYTFQSLFRIKLKPLKEHLKKNLTPSSFLNVIIFIFAFSYPIQLISGYLNIRLDTFTQMIILFFLIEVSRSIKKLHYFTICGILSVLRVVLSFNSIYNFPFLKNFFVSIFLFQGLRIFLSFLMDSLTEDVKIKDLKPGMVLTEHIFRKKETYAKKSFILVNIVDIFRSLKDEILSEIDLTLNKENIKELQTLHKEKKLNFESVKITKTIPFAPFIFLGTLVTYLVQGNLIYYLYKITIFK